MGVAIPKVSGKCPFYVKVREFHIEKAVSTL